MYVVCVQSTAYTYGVHCTKHIRTVYVYAYNARTLYVPSHTFSVRRILYDVHAHMKTNRWERLQGVVGLIVALVLDLFVEAYGSQGHVGIDHDCWWLGEIREIHNNEGWIPVKERWISVDGGWISINGGLISVDGGWISANEGWLPANEEWIWVNEGLIPANEGWLLGDERVTETSEVTRQTCTISWLRLRNRTLTSRLLRLRNRTLTSRLLRLRNRTVIGCD